MRALLGNFYNMIKIFFCFFFGVYETKWLKLIELFFMLEEEWILIVFDAIEMFSEKFHEVKGIMEVLED